ncbi:hypothetical protein [Mucilaginibacter gossypiicola]|uniref:hypothetical protein n=1 Tax=Mucilaginibacter gossypiicola TaxID=551995 RepID=UPI001AD8123D|nr:hypothetical protein [Mucilaginibacter gossypiicola]
MKELADSLYADQAQTQIAEKESDTWYGQAWIRLPVPLNKVFQPLLHQYQPKDFVVYWQCGSCGEPGASANETYYEYHFNNGVVMGGCSICAR